MLLLGSGLLMSEVGVGAGVAIIVVVLRVGRRCEGGGIVVEG